MKKTILLSSIFAVGAAFAAATVDSPNVIGTLPVEVSTGQQLMAAPFADSDGTIAVNDMVKTDDLSNGDALYVAKSDGYEKWTFNATTRKWDPAKKVTIGADGSAVVGDEFTADEVRVKRGDAFWLQTAKGGNVTLLGSKSEFPPAVAVANKWNLVSNPTIGPKTLAGGVNGDKVAVPSAATDGYLRVYTFRSGSGWWYADGDGRHFNQTITVHAGKGVWYFASGSNRELW